MKIIKGSLVITKYNYKECEKIEKVEGSLSIHSDIGLKELKSVGSYLYIHDNAELKAYKLKSVGKDLYINSNAELTELESVGKDLYIYSKARVTLKKLNHIKGKLYIYPKAKLNLSPEVEAYMTAKSI